MPTARPLLPWPQQFPELSPAVGKPGGVVVGTRAQRHSEPAAEQRPRQKKHEKEQKYNFRVFSLHNGIYFKGVWFKTTAGKDTPSTQLYKESLYEGL